MPLKMLELPRIRSERPALELHYPEYVGRFRNEAQVGGYGSGTSAFEVAAQGVGSESLRAGEHYRPRCVTDEVEDEAAAGSASSQRSRCTLSPR